MSEKQHHGDSPFMQLEDWVVDILMSDQLTKTDHRLFWYLFKLDRWGDHFVDLPSQSEIALHLGVRRETINQSQAKLHYLGLLPNWMPAPSIYESTELQIRDRLKSELGGLTEVVTPAGRIDLLTETEVIEIKHLSEWKSAMGQVLAYSGFYPEHHKRIHLFGKSDETVIATAMAICLELGITVTFEEVS